MSDIVERLGYHHEHPVHGTMVLRNPDGPEAAATITTLRAEVERLRAALRHILALAPNQGNAMQIKARAALAQEPTNDRDDGNYDYAGGL